MKNNDLIIPAFMMPEDRGSDSPRGVILAANDSRFVAGNVSTELTQFASGAAGTTSAALLAELNIVAPVVRAPRRYTYRVADKNSYHLTETDDVRAVGAAFKRVQSTGTETEGKTLNKGLTVVLDKDEIVAGREESETQKLIDRLLRNDLVRAYTALIAAATSTAKVWNGDADPDSDIALALSAGGDARGSDGNVVVYGGNAWLYRFASYGAAKRTNGGGSQNLTPEQLAQLFMLDSVVVSRQRKQLTSSTKGKVLGGTVLSFMAQQNASLDDPSNIKRFVTPTGNGLYTVYREEKTKTIEISVEHYSAVTVTDTNGIQATTVTQAAVQG